MRWMHWDAIVATGEIVGSVAVFVMLGKLALQVRLSRLEAPHRCPAQRKAALEFVVPRRARPHCVARW